MTKHRNPAIWMLFVILAVAVPTGLLMAIFSWNNRPPNIKIPTYSVPKDNGWDYFVRAAEMIGRTKHYGPMSDPTQHKWTLAEYESFMRDNAAALAALREGLQKPCAYPPVRSYYDTTLDVHGRLREAARTLAGTAEYYRLIGRPLNAANAHLDCIQVGVKVPTRGNLMAGLVGSTIQAIGAKNIELSLPKLDPAELQDVAVRLHEMHSQQVTFSDILIDEGYSSTAGLQEQLRKHRSSLNSAFDDWSIREPVTSTRETLREARYAFCSKSAVLRDNLQYYKSLANEQRGYYTGDSRLPVPSNAFTALAGSPEYVLRARKLFERNNAQLTIIQTEVALLRYRASHGRFPNDLNELMPTYLKSLPIDPFGMGQPLRYKLLSKDKFLLYSRGYDLKDDGGKPIPLWDTDDKGDFVAGHLDMQRP